jgi:A nuclease family of the HNH/ENDO VII superfamily with conserved AHH
MQMSLEYAYPALAAVEGGTGKDPQDIPRVQSKIPGKFDGVRSNIDQLSNDLKVNPSAVINLDSVVSQQLNQLRKDKSVTPEQVKQLEKSIKDEKEGKKRNELLSGLAGAGLTIGSFFVPGAGEVSMAAKATQVMRVLGAGLSLYSASSALPDLMMLDKATQAQRGGAGKLTPQSEGEAKFNLYMGYTNLVLAGVDAGAHKLAFNVAKSAGSKGLQALSKLDRAALAKLLLNARALRAGQSPEMVQVMHSLRQATGNDKKLYEQLLDAFKKARDKFPPSGGGSPQLATEGVGGNAGRVTEELGKKNQPLKSQGAGDAGTVANPNISAEVAAKWSKTKNWNDVEPIIGQQAGGKLPDGYEYKTLKRGTPEERTIIARTKGNGSDANTVPLQIGEDGTFQVTTHVTNRISNPAAMRKNFEKAYGKIQSGYWIHHLIPDEIMRSNSLAKLSRTLGYGLDDSSNLIGLANKEQWAKGVKAPGNGYSDAVGHWSGHDQYSKQVTQYLNDEARRLEKKFGDLNQALKDPKQKKQLIKEVNQVMQDAENEFRSLIEKGNIPKKDGRLAWNNEKTEPTA